MRDDAISIDPAILIAFQMRPTSWIAPGVAGQMSDHGDEVRIGLIIALDEGNGDVGRFLDTLPDDRIVRVTNVVSSRLAGMLQRRGFTGDRHGDWSRGSRFD